MTDVEVVDVAIAELQNLLRCRNCGEKFNEGCRCYAVITRDEDGIPERVDIFRKDGRKTVLKLKRSIEGEQA